MTRTKLTALLLLVLGSLALAGCGGDAKPEGWAAPVITDDTYYLFQRKTELTAINRENGSVRWTFPDDSRSDQDDIDLEAVYGTPILANDTLYFGTYHGDLMAVAVEDGSLQWRKNLHGPVVGAPLLINDHLVIGTAEGRLFVYGTDGTIAPNWPTDGMEFNKGIWASAVALSENEFAIATMNGDLFAFALDSATPLWPEPFHVSGAIASLALTPDGNLLAPSLDRHAYLVDPATGTEVAPAFRANEWLWGQPAFEGSTAYLVDLNGNTYAINLETMTEQWSYAAENRTKAAPVIVGDTLLVADRDPVVHFIDKESGVLQHTVPILDTKTVRADPVVEDSLAYYITVDGHLLYADPEQRLVRELEVGRYRP